MTLISVPMVWPQVLPKAMLMTGIVAPGPPPAPGPTAVRPKGTVRQALAVRRGPLTEPVAIPRTTPILVDPKDEIGELGVYGSVGPASSGPGGGGFFDSIIGGIPQAPVARERPPEIPRPVAPPKPAAEPPRIIRVSEVQMAQAVRRIEPEYPALARQMRVSGVVQLEGIIATDGHMREVRVLSGHPLLAAAALNAVRQWIYKPTVLNGAPVEVMAPITVTFHLR